MIQAAEQNCRCFEQRKGSGSGLRKRALNVPDLFAVENGSQSAVVRQAAPFAIVLTQALELAELGNSCIELSQGKRSRML